MPPPPDRHLMFIAVKGAHEGRTRKQISRILRNAKRHDGGQEVRFVGAVDEVCACLDAASPDTIPVAAGGDGTVNLVAQAVRRYGPRGGPMGILPLGTGNLMAHEMGVGSAACAIDVLLHGTARALDVMVTTHPQAPIALMSISIGFEARALHRLARWRRWGRPMGILGWTAASLGPRRKGTSLSVDGESILACDRAYYNVGLYNMARYAFGRLVLPDAVPNDGECEAVLHLQARQYVRTVLKGLQRSNTGLAGGTVYRRWRRAAISTAHSVQVDGEPVRGGTFEVYVEPRGLQVFAAPLPPTQGEDGIDDENGSGYPHHSLRSHGP